MASGFDIARSEYQNYRFCYENGHKQWLQTARACFDFWRGRQWKQEDMDRLRAAGRPALTFNVIESLVRVMKGIQRALRNDVRFAPVKDADAASANILDMLWLGIQNENDLDFLETDLYEIGLITGRAYYDIRAEYDHQLQGNVVVSRRRSQDVILDPTYATYDTNEWPQVINVRWTNLQDIEYLFGKDAAQALPRRDYPEWIDIEDRLMASHLGESPYYAAGWGDVDHKLIRAYRLIERQYFDLKHKEVFIDMQTGDTSEIPETWERNRIAHVLQVTPGLGTMRRKVKTVRWRAVCEDQTFHDEDSPYKAFTIVPFFPSFVDGVSMGAVESLIGPQELYNKVTSQELHIVNTTANSGWKVKRNNLKNMTPDELERVGSKPGFVAVVDEMDGLEKIEPNQVPQGHDRISFKADKIMRDLAGVPQSARGFAREDVAGEAIESNQAATDLNFAGWLSNLHRSKTLLARRAVDIIQSTYNETRLIAVNRGSIYAPQTEHVPINMPTPEGQVLNDVTRGKYTTVLVPSPARSTMSQTDIKEIIELKKLGINIPDISVIEASSLQNKGPIIQAMTGDSNEQQKQLHEVELRKAQSEEELTAAKVEKERGAAALNTARAQKAAGEAGRDPDAAYERVEMARIGADQQASRGQLTLAAVKERREARQGQQKIAVDLTRIDHEDHNKQKDREHKLALEKAKPKPKPAGMTRRKQHA